MDLVTFGLGITSGTRLGSTGGNGRQREGNFRAGNHHWDTLGKQREAMDLVTLGLGIITGHAWEATGAMDLVTFDLGITTGAPLRSNGRP